MKTYLGILNDASTDKLTTLEQQLGFLIENELFYKVHSYQLDIHEKDTQNPPYIETNFKPTEKLVNSFYDYIKKEFSADIDIHFLMFFKKFNDEIYGLEENEQRKIALKEFKRLYDEIKVLDSSLLWKKKSENGIENVVSMNRFQFLKARQKGQKTQLANTDNIFEFLNGNEVFFKDAFQEVKSDFKAFVDFESTLKILISLNDLYQFEEDLQFSELGQLKLIYEKYTTVFISFKVFCYAHKKIQSFRASKKAHIGSLYDVLLDLQLIQRNKNRFTDYINLEHGIQLSKIKTYQEGENWQHDSRVKNYKEELQKQITK